MTKAKLAATAAGVAVAVVVVVAVVRWASAPEPPPPIVAPRFPVAPEAHPVLPPAPEGEEPAAKPAQAFCEVRDLGTVAMALRSTQVQVLDAAKRAAKKGGPVTCRAKADEGETRVVQAVDALGARTGACVARDAELDSQWNQLDSAVLALGLCNDCTHGRDDRLIGCKRVLELIASAERSMK